VDILKKMTGSYEALFSRQSVRYKKLKESEKPKSEREFREWLINDYTSLKRPVFVFDNEISINDVSKALSWL
jgi:arsenate reductase